jgi:nitroreductase
MTESTRTGTGTRTGTPRDRVRPLLRTRQVREFTDRPIDPADLDAMADVARWSGSSSNEQPWRFIVIRDTGVLRRLAEAGRPMTRPLATATAAIAIALPDEKERAVSRAYDEGRAAERILVAASMLGLAGGVSWIINDARATVREILGIPADHFVRTIIALGHPTEGARRPKSAPGQARLPREEVVFEERWPA